MSDEDGPLNIENGDPYQDIYYIHEFKMLPNYDNEFLKNRIIEELPGLILKLLHVAPDIIAYYPAPLEYEPDPDKEFRYDTLQAIVAQRLNSLTNSIDVDEKENKSLITTRPFRASHHNASLNSLIGGNNAAPGEISLSHNLLWKLLLQFTSF